MSAIKPPFSSTQMDDRNRADARDGADTSCTASRITVMILLRLGITAPFFARCAY
jgi:hypothetical protein